MLFISTIKNGVLIKNLNHDIIRKCVLKLNTSHVAQYVKIYKRKRRKFKHEILIQYNKYILIRLQVAFYPELM